MSIHFLSPEEIATLKPYYSFIDFEVPSSGAYLACKTTEQLLAQLERDNITKQSSEFFSVPITPFSKFKFYRIIDTTDTLYFTVDTSESDREYLRQRDLVKSRNQEISQEIMIKYPLLGQMELSDFFKKIRVRFTDKYPYSMSARVLPDYPIHSPEYRFCQYSIRERDLERNPPDSRNDYFMSYDKEKGKFYIIKFIWSFEQERVLDGLDPWAFTLQLFERQMAKYKKSIDEQDKMFVKVLQEAPMFFIKEERFPTRADFVLTQLQEKKAQYGNSFEYHPILAKAEEEAKLNLMKTYEPDKIVPLEYQKQLFDTFTDKRITLPKLARRASLGKQNKRRKRSKYCKTNSRKREK